MLSISDPTPDSDRAKGLARTMDVRLLDSLDGLIATAERGLKTTYSAAHASVNAARDAIIGAPASERLTFRAYALHAELRHLLRRNDGAAVIALLDDFPAYAMHSRSMLDIKPFPKADTTDRTDLCFLNTLRREHQRTYNTDLEVGPPEAHRLEVSRDLVIVALDRLGEVDPYTRAELDVYVRDIEIAATADFNAGTSFPLFGCIYLAEIRPQQSWTAYLEHLVHEAAHHHLFALWTQDAILADDGDYYRSPLRPEPRPLSGIYHAMFVLARVLRTQRIFIADGRYADEVLAMSTQYKRAGNSASFLEKIEEAALLIEQSAQMSDLGAALFKGCRIMATP